MRSVLSPDPTTIIIPNIEVAGPRGSIQTDMILDTGAAYCMLSWRRILALGYPRHAHRPLITLLTVGGAVQAPIVYLRRLQIDDIWVRHIPVVCYDLPGGVEVSGLLGLNALKKWCTTIDYRNLLLRLE